MSSEQQPTEPPVSPPPVAPDVQEERNLAMLAHLAGLVVYVAPVPGLANILAPFGVWMWKKDQMPFVDDQGKEAVNFQITVTLAAAILGAVSFFPFAVCLTVPLLLCLVIAQIVMTVIAALQARDGNYHRYPMSIPFVK